MAPYTMPESFPAGNRTAASNFQNAGDARGLIQPVGRPPLLEHERILPSRALTDIVRHFWWVRWDLEEPIIQENLPHPAVHLVFQDGEARILGVTTGRFTVELRGASWVFGVRFQPGGFSGFLDRPVSSLTGRSVPAAELFGREAEEVKAAVLSVAGAGSITAMERRVDLLSEFLLRRARPVSEEARLASRLARRLEEEQDLLRVEDLCAKEGLSARKVQRLFQKHVGVPPRWVISRYRLHEALARLEVELVRDNGGKKIHWSSFALDLGYYDQSHFIKDFITMVGCTPESYEKRCRCE